MARVSLPTVFGVPLRTSWSWIIVALSLTIISFYQLAPEPGANAALAPWIAGAVALAIGCVLSVLAHEYGHVWIARQTGTTLSALEPSLIGALPDTCYVPENPSREVRVALAGPAVSLALTLLLGSIWIIAGQPETMPWATIFLLAAFNALLTVLGLAPGYPFDGGRIFRAFLWYLTDDLVGATRIAALYGQLLIFLGLLGGIVLLSIGETLAVWGTWVLIVCWTLNRARTEGFVQTVWREAGKSLRIDDLFQAGVNRVPASANIDESIESLLDNFRRGPTLVMDGHDVIGVVELGSVRRVPRAMWTQTPVRDVMTSIEDLVRMESSEPVARLLAEFPTQVPKVVLVQKDGKIVAAADRDFTLERVESYIRAERLNRRRRR